MTNLTLDRIALDDAGGNPRKIAEAIHLQLGDLTGPVPVDAIAHALDIVEIRKEPLTSFEGALITNVRSRINSGQCAIKSTAAQVYGRPRTWTFPERLA